MSENASYAVYPALFCVTALDPCSPTSVPIPTSPSSIHPHPFRLPLRRRHLLSPFPYSLLHLKYQCCRGPAYFPLTL